jgi:ABC-type spermidine/putrescine transport system permease subunit I
VATVTETKPAAPDRPPHAATLKPAKGSRKSRWQARSRQDRLDSWKPRWLWASLAMPGSIWLLLFFLLPFYAILCVAFGTLDPIFQSPVPIWNPFAWDPQTFVNVYHELSITFASPFWRTVWYVAVSSLLSLVIAYPVAYFVTRHAGKRKSLYLILLISPFWVSYMMRMLAWIDLLQTNGWVNDVFEWLGLMNRSTPANWLGGHSLTVILGLVYGYIPYLIIVLYAGLDRIDGRLLEASQDLGFTKLRTFWRVTVPLSRQTILAGMFVTVLPMVGDYFTNQLLSARKSTTMIGNTIEGQLNYASAQSDGAAASVILLLLLVPAMIYYVRSTNKASRENA